MTTTLGKSLKRKRKIVLLFFLFAFIASAQLISSQFFFLCVPILFILLSQYYTFFCVIRKNSEYSIDPIVWILQKLLLITFTTITIYHNVSINVHFCVIPSTLWPLKMLTLDAIIRVNYCSSNINLRLLFMDPQAKETANCQV